MIYNAIIDRVLLCGCGEEGDLLINIDGTKLRVYYQAPDDFIMEYLVECSPHAKHSVVDYEILDKSRTIPIDIWLVYGKPEISEIKVKKYPADISVCGGSLFGEVVEILQNGDFRLDCGISIDIRNSKEANRFSIGEFVEVRGTYQVCFPDTVWDFL